jgi:hypothetical protein
MVMFDTVELTLFVSLAVLSAVGSIPHLLQWLKLKPHLKIVKAIIEKQPDDNNRYSIHLEVENQSKWWRKNGDATNIMGEYYVVDKNGFQNGYVDNQLLSQHLLAGTKTVKDLEGYHLLSPEGNPYSIVFRIKHNEAVMAALKITYNVPS